MNTISNLGAAIYASLASALGLFFSFIPRLVGFLVILLIGWIVAKALEKGVALLLRRAGFDRVGDRIGLQRMEQQLNMHMDASGILGRIVFWFVFLISLIPAFNALELTAVSSLLNSVIGYLPNIFVAIIVLFLGMLLATLAYDVTVAASTSRIRQPRYLGNVIRYAIIGFTVLIALEQLQIAPQLINILFTAVVGGAALALALSFGLGGRETAQRLLSRSESVLNAPRTADGNAPYANQPFNQAPPLGKNQPNSARSDMPTQEVPASAQVDSPRVHTGTEAIPPNRNMPPRGQQKPYRNR